MSIITAHWSATSPDDSGVYHRLGDYHAEFGLIKPLSNTVLTHCRNAVHPADVPWSDLSHIFAVWKNYNFDTATSYGTWMWNHDFRDNTPNIEVAALCMGGSDVCTTDFGAHPFTKAHAWMMAGVIARIAKLKGIDPMQSFEAVNGYMNGPLFAVSTHGERAYQTENMQVENADRGYSGYRGYGAYSADPDMRWDLDVLDVADLKALGSFQTAYAATKSSAAWLRNAAASIIHANYTADMWGLDVAVAR
jgi:hypothetical protein